MSEDTSLYDLLDLSIGTPQDGAVNFRALHALLRGVLTQLDTWGRGAGGTGGTETRGRETGTGGTETWGMGTGTGGAGGRETETRGRETGTGGAGGRETETQGADIQGSEPRGTETWGTETPPGGAEEGGPSGRAELDQQEVQVGSGLLTLRSRIQTCEDDVSKALTLIKELQEQRDRLRGEIEELHHQQKSCRVQAEAASAVDACCHRVDVLEETVRRLSDTFGRRLQPEEQSQRVTLEDMKSDLLSETEPAEEEPLNSGAVDPTTTKPSMSSFSGANAAAPRASSSSSSSQPVQDSVEPEDLSSPPVVGDTSTQPAMAAVPVQSGPLKQTEAGSGAPGASDQYPEVLEALRDIRHLREKFSQLEARIAALEDRQEDQTQLRDVRELIANTGSQDAASKMLDELNQQRASVESLMSDCEKNVQLVSGVQAAFLQLRAECEKLHESNRCLQEDNRRAEGHIEELLRKTEELEDQKADKQMVESEISADKSALEDKVSRLQLESVTEQLDAAIQELLSKVTGQERHWHKVIDRLSSEMDCKLSRTELDSLKKQLEGRWKNVSEKLRAQEAAEAPECDDAAALRKQLLDRFHCLSCDRPVVKYSAGQHLVKLQSSPGFPAHKSIRPFTVYALEQFRQHCRSDGMSGLADYSHMTVSRNCGGSHTVNVASQRRQAAKLCAHTEADLTMQSEEVDIVGLDGHIYRGRLNSPAVRNAETKLPAISPKDAGLCRTKDKARQTKAAASPEVGHGVPLHIPSGARSAQSSRSGSSSSGRDWPVSALGCVSSSAEPQSDPPLDL